MGNAETSSSCSSSLSSDSDTPYVYSSPLSPLSRSSSAGSDISLEEEALDTDPSSMPTALDSKPPKSPAACPLIPHPKSTPPPMSIAVERAKTVRVHARHYVTDKNLAWLTCQTLAHHSAVQYHEPTCSHVQTDPTLVDHGASLGKSIHIPMLQPVTSFCVGPILTKLRSRGFSVLSFRFLQPTKAPVSAHGATCTANTTSSIGSSSSSRSSSAEQEDNDMVILEVHLDPTSAYFSWTSLIGSQLKVKLGQGEDQQRAFYILHPPLPLDQLWAIRLSGWNPKYKLKDLVEWIEASWKTNGVICRIDALGVITNTSTGDSEVFVPSDMGGMIVRTSTQALKLSQMNHPEFGRLKLEWTFCIERCKGVVDRMPFW